MVNGPTGVGKTTLISRILPARAYVVVFVTKVHDDTLTKDFHGFEVIRDWPPKASQNKVLLWPKPDRKGIKETILAQKATFRDAMNKIFLERNWCTVFDEQHYICGSLGLQDENMMFQHQGRSSGLSVVNGAQRPAWVPLITLSGSTHYFLWKNTHNDDLKRLANIGGADKRELSQAMLTLGKHEFIYLNPRTGVAVISQVER